MITFQVTVARFDYAGIFPHGFVAVTEPCSYRQDFAHSCDAVIDAIDKFPQAGYISVKAVQSCEPI